MKMRASPCGLDRVMATLLGRYTVTPRMLLLPGGTSIASVAMAHAGLHKIIELHEERQADPNHPAPHTIAVLRDPALVPPSTLRGTALSPSEVFPDLAHKIEADPHFFDGIDLIIETSGSTTGKPKRVGLSIEAILASIDATHEALGGAGTWILALPAHHIAGAMALLRSTRHDFPPRIVDTSAGFTPEALLPAIRGAHSTGAPAYLSLVPTQLRACLANDEVTTALATLNGILVGGQAVSCDLLEEARSRALKVYTSYGMSETSSGIAYNGQPLRGTQIRILDPDPTGHGRIIINSPTLMTRYLEGDEPWVTPDGQPWTPEAGDKWLLTSDRGSLDDHGTLTVVGRIDDVIISGGKNIIPSQVENALNSAKEISDSCVVAISDETWGQCVAALLVATPGAFTPLNPMAQNTAITEADAQRLREHVAQSLGKHASPRIVVLAENLPTLPSGKVDRSGVVHRIREAINEGTAWVR